MKAWPLLIIAIFLSACSLLVDGGESPDATLDGQVLDTLDLDATPDTNLPEPLDGSPAPPLMADSQVDQDTSPLTDAGVDSTPASGPDRDVSLPLDMGQHDATPAPPPCQRDLDCGDARRCLEGSCESLVCNGCRQEQICFQGCCQDAARRDEPGECAHPAEMMLGVPLLRDVGDLEWGSEWQPTCARVDAPEVFGRFVPEETDTYCIQADGVSSVANLFLQLNCCDERADELACDAASFLDRRTVIERQLYAGVSYLIGYEDRRRAAQESEGPRVTQGPCRCASEDDCDIVHLCVEGRCEDRRGQPCDDAQACGRRGVCTPPPDSICVEDM